MEKVQFLESVLGSSIKANRDYYQFTCPFCLHHKKKLGVAVNSGRWRCWVCPSKGSNIQILLRKLRVEPSKVKHSEELWQIQPESVNIVELPTNLTLPPEFLPLWLPTDSLLYKKAKGYLYERGITQRDVLKHKIGYCPTGSFKETVVFPSYAENLQLNHFLGRTFTNSFKKFQEPTDVSKDLVQDEWLINWSEPIVIVESQIDAITVKRNAVPVGGKIIHKALKVKILESKTPKITFCLDGDALKDAMLNAEYFIKHGLEVYIAELPDGEDPNSLGFKKVWEFIDNARPIKESDIFKFKVLNKLKG